MNIWIYQATAFLGSFKESPNGSQISFMTQKKALNLTAAPVVDGEAHCVHTQRMIAQKVTAKIYLQITA